MLIQRPQTTNHKPQTRMGFTLIETLVAISILLLSISAPFTIASRSIAASFFARDQITAFYLAQDAVEYVRYARDTNFLSGVLWLNALRVSEDPFTIDTTISNLNDAMSTCPLGVCAVLVQYSNGSYGYNDVNGKPSIFTRSVSMKEINEHEIIVSVTVSWSVGNFDRSFSVKESIFNWQ